MTRVPRPMCVTASAVERFFSYVRKTEKCWFWGGGQVDHRYGAFYDGKNRLLAHRWSFFYHFDIDPGKLGVLHHCDNGLCVCPDCLFLGSQVVNSTDCYSKQRSKQAKLTPEQVLDIRTKRVYQQDFARLYGVSTGTVANVQQGALYKWVI